MTRIPPIVARFTALLILAAGPAAAATFGIPGAPGPADSPASGYLLVIGRDVAWTQGDIAPLFGDPTMTGCAPPVPLPGEPGDPCGQIFYIEVTGDSRLEIDLYDPGLYEPDPALRVGPQLDVSYDTDAFQDPGDGEWVGLGEMHYELRDPAGVLQEELVLGADTQGAGGSNANLVRLAGINNAEPGVWTLHAYMADTAWRDEEVNVFGLIVDTYDVYTYYPVVGHAAAGGAPPDSALPDDGRPLLLYPWIHGASGVMLREFPGDPGQPVYGLAFFNFDLDAPSTPDPDDDPALGEPPPEIVRKTAQGGISPDCATDPAGCFHPSVNGGTVRANRDDINQSPVQGTDHGIYVFEFSGMDATWGVTELEAPAGTPDDLNAFTLQARAYDAPLPDPGSNLTDFPVVPASGENLWRWYLPADGIFGPTRPLKEWMGIQAVGPAQVDIGAVQDYAVLWDTQNPTGYDLLDFQAAIHVNDAAAISPPDPVTLLSIGPLRAFVDTDPGSTCPNTQGTDPKRIVICGDLPAGADNTVMFDITLTAVAGGTSFLLGRPDSDTDPAGGSRPTLADYKTPFTPGPEREGMGPLLAPWVQIVAPLCSASVAIDDPGPYCSGEPLTLTTTGSVQSCPGTAEYNWSTADGRQCLNWFPGVGLTLPSGQCPTPTGPTTYRVDVRCSDDWTCTASDTFTVVPDPQVFADAGPDTTYYCAGDSAFLGVDYPARGLLTGMAEGRDSCTELTYSWAPTADLSPGFGICGPCADAGSCPYPLAAPPGPAAYTVTVIDPVTGCAAQDTVQVEESNDDPPLPVGCTLRVAKEFEGDLAFHWRDVDGFTQLYEVVALEPSGGTSPCPDHLPATWPPDLTAMDGAPVVAMALARFESALWIGGQTACPSLMFFKVRPTLPCSGIPVFFEDPLCD